MATIRTLDDTVSRTSLDLKRSSEDVTDKRGRITELEALLSGTVIFTFNEILENPRRDVTLLTSVVLLTSTIITRHW